MKLFYYKDPVGNFGDDLNPWLFYTLIPEVFNQEDNNYLVGIGTLLNDRAPKDGKKIVFGSGVGYHNPIALDESWHFRFVRGPLSAQKIGMDKTKYITDPAILAGQLFKNQSSGSLITYMPHHVSDDNADWKKICEMAGLTYLSPADNIHQTLHLISQSKFVIAEAMHAAIVADALRVPWVPVTAYPHILDFKWKDWCESLGMSYEPTKIESIWNPERNLSSLQKKKNSLKRTLISWGVDGSNWTPPPPLDNWNQAIEKIVLNLEKIKESAKIFLSKDDAHSLALEQINIELHHLKKNY